MKPGAEREELVPKVRAVLVERFLLRTHVFLLVSTTVLTGFIVSTALQSDETLRTMLRWRYLIATVPAYLVFLVGVHWWARHVAGVRPATGHESNDRGRFDERRLETARPKDDDGPPGDISPDPGCFDGCASGGEGCLAGLAVVAVLVALWWLLSFGSTLFAEVVADTLLAGGMYRWVSRTEAKWLKNALRATLPVYGVIAVAFYAFGWWAQSECPNATRFGQIWACRFP